MSKFIKIDDGEGYTLSNQILGSQIVIDDSWQQRVLEPCIDLIHQVEKYYMAKVWKSKARKGKYK